MLFTTTGMRLPTCDAVNVFNRDDDDNVISSTASSLVSGGGGDAG